MSNNVIAEVGPTVSNFVQALDNDATIFANEGNLVDNPQALVQAEILKAMYYVTPAPILAAMDDDVFALPAFLF